MNTQDTNLGPMPVGLSIIKYVYAAIALVAAFSAIFFSRQSSVICCGLPLGATASAVVNSVLVLFPLILYFGFCRPTVTIWYLALLYHIFFVGNNILNLLSSLFPHSPIRSMLKIVGKTVFDDAAEHGLILPFSLNLFMVFNITVLLGIFILWYLWNKKEYFMPRSVLKKI